MKEYRNNSSLPEDTIKVFEQLDKCVEEARKFENADATEHSEAKAKADQEAKRLAYLTGFSQTATVLANSVGVISGLASQNWTVVFISATGAISAGIEIYLWHKRR